MASNIKKKLPARILSTFGASKSSNKKQRDRHERYSFQDIVQQTIGLPDVFVEPFNSKRRNNNDLHNDNGEEEQEDDDYYDEDDEDEAFGDIINELKQLEETQTNVDLQHVGEKLLDRNNFDFTKCKTSKVCPHVTPFHEIFLNFGTIMPK